LVRDILIPYLHPTDLVLDYGCGPGYMAAAVAPFVRRVEAIDISKGVLACAHVLNGASNIDYETPQSAEARDEGVDLAYSFAVIQHLTDEALGRSLALLRRRVRRGGVLLIHFPVPNDKWRTEGEWKADQSITGRAKLRFGLNCFGRTEDQIVDLVVNAGFQRPHTIPLAALTVADPDIAGEWLLIASG
jgi:SAM-dependent methyltransferase